MVNDINNLSTSGFEIRGFSNIFGCNVYIKSKKFFQEIHLCAFSENTHKIISWEFSVFGGYIVQLDSSKEALQEFYNKQYKDIDNELLKFALDNWDNLEKLCQAIK